MKVSRVKRETVHDRVYEVLRDALISGAIQPGSNMTIRALADAVGTSPMPVREALRRLVAEGALVMRPNRTISVPKMSVKRFDELCKIRIALEGMAAEEATRRMSAADIDQLVKINKDMRKQRRASAFLERNRQFHFLIYRAAQMEELRSIVESLWLRVGPFLNLVLNDSLGSSPIDRHTSFLTAVRARDPKRARQALVDDITSAASRIRQLLEQSAEKEKVTPP